MSIARVDDHLVEVWGLTQTYPAAGSELVAIRDVELTLGVGERLAIVGPSGSGKSVLLRVLAGLEKPHAGRVRVAGYDLMAMNDGERAGYSRQVSFVCQRPDHALWPALTVEENVQLSVSVSPRVQVGAVARDLLTAVGLAGREGWRPADLTTGERRRLAFAAGLASQPRLLLVDDPLGGLDADSAEELRACMDDVLGQQRITSILATRDHRAAPRVDWVVELPGARTLSLATNSSRPPRRADDDGRAAVLDVRGVQVGSSRRGRRPALSEVSFQVREGELVSMVGEPGAERSALLALCGGREQPDAGLVLLAGDVEQEPWRKVGWMAQVSIPSSLTVGEEVAFAARIAGGSPREPAALATMVLRATGLEHHATTPVNQLSAWEERCAALARALARVPVLVIAEEPTAGLDPQASAAILSMLREVADSGVGILLATSQKAVARSADRVLVLAGGRVREVDPFE